MNADGDSIAPLREFVVSMTRLVESTDDEATIISKTSTLLKQLIATDHWLPEFCTQPHPKYYQQYLLHADPLERFSVVSFVWGPEHKTPVHDHGVWGVIGMLRGAERNQSYSRSADGKLTPVGDPVILAQGNIETVSPRLGDIHQVENACADPSISINVYGANIGAVARHAYDLETGISKGFVSGYSSELVPNLWDRSVSVRAKLG
jgi:predicted metal-dependent enzyme (double-stranded beta helix superfamily)